MAKPTMSTLNYNEGGTFIGTSTTGAIALLSANDDLLNTWADEHLLVDGTVGRVLRRFRLTIADGTNAATIKPKTANLWNGDAVAEENNLAKSGDTGNFSLDVTGSVLTIDAAGLTGNAIAQLDTTVIYNASATDLNARGAVAGNNLTILFTNSTTAAALDLTTLVDTGEIRLDISYITSS
uniref:Uncharacterized protein n=1 Tax=viral metagenome TaxID=1070528 RepID=A0A6M3K3B9_9ZZZZ